MLLKSFLLPIPDPLPLHSHSTGSYLRLRFILLLFPYFPCCERCYISYLFNFFRLLLTLRAIFELLMKEFACAKARGGDRVRFPRQMALPQEAGSWRQAAGGRSKKCFLMNLTNWNDWMKKRLNLLCFLSYFRRFFVVFLILYFRFHFHFVECASEWLMSALKSHSLWWEPNNTIIQCKPPNKLAKKPKKNMNWIQRQGVSNKIPIMRV